MSCSFFQLSQLVKILIVTMMTLEVISCSYFSNGMSLHFYNWSCSACAEKEIKVGLPVPDLLLGLLLPASPPTASPRCCRQYGFMASDALPEPTTGQRWPLAFVSLPGGMTPLGALRSASATNPSQVSSNSSPLHCMFQLAWILFHTTHLGLEVPDNSYGRMNVCTTN
jgi:hypothetical protein